MCRLFSQIWQEMVKNPQIGVGKKNYQYYIDDEEMKSFTFDYSDKIMTRICCVDAKKKKSDFIFAIYLLLSEIHQAD